MDPSTTTTSLLQDKEHVHNVSIEPLSTATANEPTDKHIQSVS